MSSFPTLSFDNAVGLQMTSGSSVTTVRSNCSSSVTKFGEKKDTHHCPPSLSHFPLPSAVHRKNDLNSQTLNYSKEFNQPYFRWLSFLSSLGLHELIAKTATTWYVLCCWQTEILWSEKLSWISVIHYGFHYPS